MKRLITLLLLSFIILTSFAQTRDLVKELNQRAIPLDSTFSFTQAANSTLLKNLTQYRALGLGEATHGTHEFFLAKANIIKKLIGFHQFDRIGLEAPYAEVEDLNQYLIDGKGDLNEILKSFRQYTYETREFVDLIKHLKMHNATAKTKVLFYGYDFQSPYKAMSNLRSALKDPPALSAADSLIATFNSLSNELYGHQVAVDTYNRIIQDSKKMYQELDKISNPALLKNLNNYRQFLRMNDPQFSSDMGKASELRDSLMANNILEELNRGHRMIVWAHNGHVQKTKSKFSQSMGQHLSRSLKTDYAAMGLATYQGFYTGYNNNAQGVVRTNRLVVPKTSQIEYYLNQVKHKNFIISTDKLLVPAMIVEHRLLGYGVTDDQFQSGNMVDAFDYILFISNTSGSWNHYLKKQ
ncbi:erythromycin esterase family protein [Adhaeribacter swui]|uniref:Erythromycin esterase family protein n=1 Tax=Adhaeribacter swui TaxID=2086471 RepID=A0A7G7GB70_9BACT|nr:erythromycin esterase family protein [Adhaeribacter swui]QNF34404.1 erythromycin esterase family protein [Adhaeribacter swui]